MATITCLRELEEKEILQRSDIVKFTIKEKPILKYCVWPKFLNTTTKNDIIFEFLKIDKLTTAEKAYGYKPIRNSQWPESENNDFPALTRLVKKIYEIIEEKEIIFTKFTRFEIMEI